MQNYDPGVKTEKDLDLNKKTKQNKTPNKCATQIIKSGYHYLRINKMIPILKAQLTCLDVANKPHNIQAKIEKFELGGCGLGFRAMGSVV